MLSHKICITHLMYNPDQPIPFMSLEYFPFGVVLITRMRSRTAWLSPLPITAIILSIGAVEKEWELNPRQTNYELVALPTELSSTGAIDYLRFCIHLAISASVHRSGILSLNR